MFDRRRKIIFCSASGITRFPSSTGDVKQNSFRMPVLTFQFGSWLLLPARRSLTLCYQLDGSLQGFVRTSRMARCALILKISLAMLAFAANSILCRLALQGGHIDPLSFSSLRLASGAFVLSPSSFITPGPHYRCGVR